MLQNSTSEDKLENIVFGCRGTRIHMVCIDEELRLVAIDTHIRIVEVDTKQLS